jgi:hypothetical protein
MSTLMTRIILINTDNVIQIRENQRNQCFFIVRGKFSRPLALCMPSPCPHATSKPTTLILILNIYPSEIYIRKYAFLQDTHDNFYYF